MPRLGSTGWLHNGGDIGVVHVEVVVELWLAGDTVVVWSMEAWLVVCQRHGGATGGQVWWWLCGLWKPTLVQWWPSKQHGALCGCRGLWGRSVGGGSIWPSNYA
jgi:hypothetical protein